MKQTEKKVTLKKENVKKPAVAPQNEKSKLFAVLGGVVAVAVVLYAVVQWLSPSIEIYKPQGRVKEAVIVAVIDGKKIKMSELEKAKNSVPQLKEMAMEEVYNNLLEGYVNSRVILAAAKEQKIQDKPEVKRAIEDAEDQILIKAFLAEQLRARITPEKKKAIYAAELENFVPQDEVHARHILVATEKEAKDLIVKLKNGADFEVLANKYSLDKNPNAETGGDLGYFRKDMMIPELSNAIFAMDVGKFSNKPIKTPFGWHVVKVEDKRKSAPPTIEQMDEYITAKFAEITVPEILAEERAKKQVKLFDPLGVNKKAVDVSEEAEE